MNDLELPRMEALVCRTCISYKSDDAGGANSGHGVCHNKKAVAEHGFDGFDSAATAAGHTCAFHQAGMDLHAQEAEFNASLARINTARAAIVAKEGKRRSITGEIPCPVDGGVLRYSLAFNGHIRAACSNKECVRWME